jgi:antitoxin component HigA of HigAB toxin-antitoxin module
MVRLRGGLGELGLHEFLKRMILMCDFSLFLNLDFQETEPFDSVDYNITTTYDLETSFPHNIAIYPSHPAHILTPLVSSSGVTFVDKHEELGISNETATILDNMRFLILSTIKTVDRPPTP